jgi:DNA-binding XRE family transcriptional regulator
MQTNEQTPMTGAELQMMRMACGLSRQDVADLAGVKMNSAKYFETGRGGVPDDVADGVALLYKNHLENVAAIVSACLAQSKSTGGIAYVPIIQGLDDDDRLRKMAQAMATAAAGALAAGGVVVKCANVQASQCGGIHAVSWVRIAELAKQAHESQSMQHKNSKR